jgi:hypothetical protein
LDVEFLTDQQKERLSALEAVFRLPGWKLIEEWAQANAEIMRYRGADAANWETNRMALGARTAFEQLVQFREATEREFEQMIVDAKERLEAVDEIAYE